MPCRLLMQINFEIVLEKIADKSFIELFGIIISYFLQIGNHFVSKSTLAIYFTLNCFSNSVSEKKGQLAFLLFVPFAFTFFHVNHVL